jgi:hypothetical protein
MTRRRFKSSTMNFGVPLSVPSSRYIERCYGKHGKGFAGTPPRNSEIELVLINTQRQLWTVDGYFPGPHTYATEPSLVDVQVRRLTIYLRSSGLCATWSRVLPK